MMIMMTVCRQEVLLAVVVVVLGLFFANAQHPRRPSDRVIAAQDIPVTNFRCTNRTPGYYADVETGCQVYHMCTEGGQQFSYRCPNTTLFQQRMLICAHWYQVNCSRSEQDYNANLLIGQRDKPFVDESEHISIYFNSDKDFHPLKNPDDLQRLGTNGNGGGRVYNVPFKPSNVPSPTTAASPRPIDVTSRFVESTQQPRSTNFRPLVSTNSPTHTSTFHTRPPTSTTSRFFTPFITYATTTPFPQTDSFDQDYDSTTTDYYDDSINNSYNNFINRFIPYSNETESNVTNTIDFIISHSNLENDNSNIQITTSPIPPTTITTTTTTNIPLESKENNGIYNFISRFMPYPNETASNNTYDEPVVPRNTYDTPVAPSITYDVPLSPNNTNDVPVVEHRFLKRFNPNEVVPNSNFPNPFNNYNQQNLATFINPFQDPQNSFTSLIPPFQAPSINLELPQETDDTEHMESNILELRFQDPRQVFFIPEDDNQNVAIENATPITVSIPRHINQHQLHPMLFINPVPGVCNKCHPAFIVDTANCSPCVVIR